MKDRRAKYFFRFSNKDPHGPRLDEVAPFVCGLLGLNLADAKPHPHRGRNCYLDPNGKIELRKAPDHNGFSLDFEQTPFGELHEFEDKLRNSDHLIMLQLNFY